MNSLDARLAGAAVTNRGDGSRLKSPVQRADRVSRASRRYSKANVPGTGKRIGEAVGKARFGSVVRRINDRGSMWRCLVAGIG